MYRRRPDYGARLVFELLPMDGGKESSSFDPRPDALQSYFSANRRQPDVAALLLPAVLTLDSGEKSAGHDLRTFSTTYSSQDRTCITLEAFASA